MTEQLKFDPKNARKHPERNKGMIRDSLQEVGGFRSIAVDGDNIVRAGNGVYEQAQALGMTVRIVDAEPNELIAVRRQDLKGKKAVRAALLDNRAGETSDWDAAVLADIAKNESELLKGLFDDSELAEILAQDGQGQEETADAGELLDKAQALQEKWKVEVGQVYQCGRHTVACIDATDKDAVTTLIQGLTFVWCDPPYGVSAVEKNSRMKQLGWKQYANDADTTTAVLLFAFYSQFDCPMIFWGANHYAAHLPNSAGWIVWDKQDGKDSLTYSQCELAWTNAWRNVQMFSHIWDGFRKDSEKGEARYHPSQKPVALAMWAFEKFGKAGDVIVDPCLGSGISVVAAEKMGNRRVVGFDIAPEYVAVTLERFKMLTGTEPRLLS